MKLTKKLAVLSIAFASACARSAPPVAPPPDAAPSSASPAADLDARRAAAVASIARARAATLSDVSRAISLPSIERLVEDADAFRAHVLDAGRDLALARRTLDTARAYADVLSGGEDPYDYARGAFVKAYRSEWDGTLQPYSIYVPTAYDGARAWPLVVALHGAHSDHRQMLQRVFGFDNRPGESDEDASRNDLTVPDVPAIVVAPFGRGEVAGYDGLGGEDVLRVIADVRRAYKVDAERIALTGLSMGGGGTWQIGLTHPELFSALAPVCAITDARKWIEPSMTKRYDLAALDAASPVALAENAEHLRVFMFHGDADPVVPVEQSRRMAARFKALGWLGKTVTYTEYPGVDHHAWVPAYEGAKLLKTLASIKRDPKAPRAARKHTPGDVGVVGLFGKSAPRERPHLYVYGTHGAPDVVASARALASALADWGPGVSAHFAVKADTEVTDDEKARFDLVLVGAAPLNALASGVAGAPKAPVYRFVGASPFAKDHRVLVMGATTADGFETLRAFAGHNADHWAPESNLATQTF